MKSAKPPSARTRASPRPKTLVALLLAIAACSSAQHRAVLQFFFDGVPSPDAAPTAIATPAPPIGPPMPPAADAGPLTVHRPYAEGKCAKCHSSRFGKPDDLSSIFQGVPMLLAPLDELCFRCHTIEKKPFLHAPAQAGQCVLCHDPHRSPHRRMLLAPTTRALCGRCHSGPLFPTETEHAAYGDRECTDCHDPHAADHRFNLLPGSAEGTPAPRQPTVTLPRDW